MQTLYDQAPPKSLLDNQVVRFIFSAGTGFVVDILAYYLFYYYVFTQKRYTLLGLSYPNDTLSLAISFFLGVIVNFLITKFLVFTESNLSPIRQFLRFITVAIVGFFANLAVLKLFIHYWAMYPPLARPLAALSLFFASFFIHKFFSFNISHRPDEPRKHNP